ncbi:MAG TPA: nuclear transport factor 2 family protein [Jatrophihabitantaceae bacterium]|nr:nuclear transport factor 2 family protein [Jatrophihabitantaceae bacterium]
MGEWNRAELADAFEHYQRHVEDVVKTGEWARFADLFTEDATYVEHVYGTFHGRAEIRDWIVRTMTTFPGSSMVGFPPRWSVIDEDRGWIVCEIRNIMADPGDGSVHEEPNITILRYAGNGLFSNEEDVYNPARYLPMVLTWARTAEQHGRLPAAAAPWMAAYAG